MTTVSVLVNEQDDAVIVCPECHRSKHTRLTKFKHLGRPLKVKCACGSSFRVRLDQEGEPEFLLTDTDKSAARLSPSLASPQTSSFPVKSAAGDGQIHRPSFHGEVVPLFGLDLSKRFLGHITAGLYNFWGRTKIRTYVVNHTEFEGERFVFHGTGKELLLGWLKAILIYGIVGFALPFGLALFMGMMLGSETLTAVVTVTVLLMLNLLLVPNIMVNVRRYRLSHTSWRGIRFSFRGRVLDFVLLSLKGMLLTAVTFGLYYPFFATQRYQFMTANAYYGDQPFDFDGQGQDLFGSFLRTYLPSFLIPILYGFLFGTSFVTVFLSLVTLGLFWMRFFAEKQRYFWDHTSFATARFHATITEWDFMVLKGVNILFLVVTLSLGWAWTKVRSIRFLFDNLTLEGPLDLERIQSTGEVTSTTGEGLASFLEMEFDLG